MMFFKNVSSRKGRSLSYEPRVLTRHIPDATSALGQIEILLRCSDVKVQQIFKQERVADPGLWWKELLESLVRVAAVVERAVRAIC